MLTASVTIPLEGEQAAYFQQLHEEEERARQIPLRRNAAVQVILAGRGLLSQVSPETKISVDWSAGTVTLTP